MEIFLNEYLFYFVCTIAILVCMSAARLFFITYRIEKKQPLMWHIYGFATLTVAYSVAILSRKFPVLEITFYVLQVFSLFIIFLGIGTEQLSQKLSKENIDKSALRELLPDAVIGFAVMMVISVTLTFTSRSFPIVSSVLALAALIIVILTLRVQIIRLVRDRKVKRALRQSLFPLLEYLSLLVVLVVSIFSRFPDNTDNVFLKVQAREYSASWETVILFTFLAFLFLAAWSWSYIKVRYKLRVLVVLLTISVLASSLGAFMFTDLVFATAQSKSFLVLAEAAQSQQAIVEDRSRTALILAKTMATDQAIIDAFNHNDQAKLATLSAGYSRVSQIDIVHFYDLFGKVIASPTNTADVGMSYSGDSLVANVLNSNLPIRSISQVSGATAPMLEARGVYPIRVDGKLAGELEVGFKFDNTFADLAKLRTGLDLTIYAGNIRSATTIIMDDGVTRWVGSVETEIQAVNHTLYNGEETTLSADLLSRSYYSVYEPVRDVDGSVIGMISVGNPTAQLLEDARQQLLTAFLILSALSLIAGGIGFLVIRNSGSEALPSFVIGKKK